MNVDHCNGRPYMSGSEGEPLREHGDSHGHLRVPTASTPDRQQSSPNQPLSVNSIKVELHSDDELGGAPQPERRKGEKDDGWRDNMIEKGSGGQQGFLGRPGSCYGERAGPQTESPGPIRLPNGKLKCEVCGMICIGPNVLMVHKRSHTGERPFQCTECGASFTQKGNLLRHMKLHSGEKPFKCVFCDYACRRRDALTGHIRTHTVPSPTMGKPFKCSYCGRSYKQQSSLEKHLEHCQSYLQNLQDHQAAFNTDQTAQVEDSPVMEPDLVVQPSTDKLCFIDRLANSITKRKSSTPQKFVGDKHTSLYEPDRPQKLSPCPENNQEGDLHSLPSSHLEVGSGASGSVGAGLEGRYLRRCGAGGDFGSEPPQLAPPHPVGLAQSDASPGSSSLYCHLLPLGAPLNGRAVVSVGLAGQISGEGNVDVPSGLSPTDPSGPCNGCHDSKDKSDTESTAEEKRSTGFMPPTSTSNNQHHPHLQYLAPALLRSHPYFCPNPSRSKDPEDPGMERTCPMPIVTTRPAAAKGSRSPTSGLPPVSRKAFVQVQVVDGRGRAVRSFRCEHCRMFFLDHVMFTIHMGCHGFRQPFQCNVCGHRSLDRYQFSSHIVRGEHQVG
uniref:C2H2-type domain-containing protein n=2 Tax=Esox lucius TaxID=8010 RepID=A0AAY5L9H4_ESOLU